MIKDSDADHSASVDGYCIWLIFVQGKEGQSIRSYWSPGSMKGHGIHNAEPPTNTSYYFMVQAHCIKSL